MPTAKKVEQIAKIRDLVAASGAIYFADLSRLKAVDMAGVRRRFRKQNVRLLVAKNRLTRRALSEAGIASDLAQALRGPTSLVIGPVDEPYAAARLLRELGQQYREWKFKGAFVEQALFAPEQFEALASMPTRPELHAQLVGVLQSPFSQLAMVLEGLIRSLIGGLEELQSKRAAGAVDAAAPTA
jgi:large subunit ribosomal protein L10